MRLLRRPQTRFWSVWARVVSMGFCVCVNVHLCMCAHLFVDDLNPQEKYWSTLPTEARIMLMFFCVFGFMTFLFVRPFDRIPPQPLFNCFVFLVASTTAASCSPMIFPCFQRLFASRTRRKLLRRERERGGAISSRKHFSRFIGERIIIANFYRKLDRGLSHIRQIRETSSSSLTCVNRNFWVCKGSHSGFGIVDLLPPFSMDFPEKMLSWIEP